MFSKTVTIPQDAILPDWLTGGDEKPESFFEGLERRNAEHHVSIGRLSVDSRPRGARIFLDGEDRGKTPTDLPDVAIGAHSVVLSLDGHRLHSETVRVASEQTATVDAALKPKMGKLWIDSTPTGATIIIDGRPEKTTPALLDLPIGRHELLLRRKNCKDRRVVVDIQSREKTSLDERLEQDPGGVAFVSDPMKAEVYLDGEGKPRGRTPLKIDRIEAGRHTAVIVKGGHGRWSGEFTVKSNEFISVTAPLTRFENAQLWVIASPADAGLWIDEHPQTEFTAVGLYDLPEGRHRIKLAKDGYRTWDQGITLKHGDFFTVRHNLEPTSYSPKGEELGRRWDWKGEPLSDYLDLGGASGAIPSQRSDTMDGSAKYLWEAHFIKYVHFFQPLRLGVGTSIIEVHGGPWGVTSRETTPTGTRTIQESPTITFLFPVHLVAAPFDGTAIARTFSWTPRLYYTFSSWGGLDLKTEPDSRYGQLRV
ncbi:MAG: PEGA domain-containing protein, partial [Chloroflexota bacterium]